jgi:hypothetical protein
MYKNMQNDMYIYYLAKEVFSKLKILGSIEIDSNKTKIVW